MTQSGPQLGRIAVVAYHSSPLIEPGSGDAGGMTIYVREVAKELARRGIRTDIFTRAVNEVPRIAEITPGVEVVAIDAGPRGPVPKDALPAHIDEFTAGVRAFVLGRGSTYDVVHSHYWQSGLTAASLADGWGIPMVHSNHTLGRVKNAVIVPGDPPEPQVRLEGEERVIRSADVLVASTDEEWEQLACLYRAPHDALKTIHPGVDHAMFGPGDRDVARAALGLGEGPIVLAVGRIQPLKGLDLAIRALEQLIPALEEPPSLYVVGGASGSTGEAEVARLKKLADDLGVGERVQLVGPRPHADLPLYYRAADALMACSHSESFGLAALEAHACGLPVVASAIGGLSFIVDDERTGFLVDDRDPTAFARRLKLLLGDPGLRREFGSNAARAARRFSWTATADSLSELYECLVTERYAEACTC